MLVNMGLLKNAKIFNNNFFSFADFFLAKKEQIFQFEIFFLSPESLKGAERKKISCNK
jgi:hypothetical protein